ncbi:acyl-CoA/acyl-ACP dehydrogenase [Amycolatopsis sp. K13G38]|uniref:Acyl-CoA/acyl-ACP dehydrogenase n=1 Tax=Amycolatopsis acididurans TaxID=2724524 RepID=A0ABX1J8A3_9PSEU|nr:acyl-CoA dehydrogenase family protein [Amycolatopsis acididurans]NKQ54695.1 acyl-CoA/acyl-ACP dehydrogenase [Amycolatopsis acididurans]
MRITPDQDAEALREVVRDFLGGDATWQRFAAELGVAALDVPERLDGAGASFREVGVVAEEIGRALSPLPWLSTSILAAGVLLHIKGSDDLRARLSSRLASGCIATLAYQGPEVSARQDGRSWRLTGTKTLVVDGASADFLFVAGNSGVFVVEGDAEGLTRTRTPAMDLTRELASVTLAGTPAVWLGETTLERVLDRARVALACEQAGGAAAALEMTVEYVRQRVQFGRPIATFQAVKHCCADMLGQVEAARSASLWAAAVAADEPANLPAAAAAAAIACGDAYCWVAGETVQLHGGIGFTWEHPAHLHVRRAATDAVLFGDRGRHAETLMTHAARQPATV